MRTKKHADARDSRGSINDLRNECLDGVSGSARNTIREMRDVVAETELDINEDM